MQEAMKNCIQNIRVLPFLLDAVYNIKEWLAPHAEQLHDHTQPKCFKFVRNATGKCEMFYRKLLSHVLGRTCGYFEGAAKTFQIFFFYFSELL